MDTIQVLDTETVYNAETGEARVYLWGCADSTGHTTYGDSIESLITYLKEHNIKSFFHNLKYDGSYLLNALNNMGYKNVGIKDKLNKREYSAIISDMRQFYAIKIKFENGKTVEILDSLKVLPCSVRELAEAFKLDISKLELDYFNEDGIINSKKIDYCIRDCEVVLQCLLKIREQGMTKITAGACALSEYKEVIGGDKNFRRIFPTLSLELDQYCRRAYKGGFVWVNPEYAGKDIEDCGEVYDVNSMFPGVMYNCCLPYGLPVYTETEPKPGILWIGRVYVGHAKVKNGYIPTIQIKGGRYADTEYLSEIADQILYITSVDWNLIKEHYILTDDRFIDGYCFKSQQGMFKQYIDKWIKVKQESTGALRYIAKLMLNSLYGKFGLNPIRRSLNAQTEDGTLKFYINAEEVVESVYVPMAAFITAYARHQIITNGQKDIKNLLYIDTDSIHRIKAGMPGFEIDNKKLGAYKLESTFTRARYLRPKTYIEEENGELIVKCAGMPKAVKSLVTWGNFKPGARYPGKLQCVQVKGGAALIEREFTIHV